MPSTSRPSSLTDDTPQPVLGRRLFVAWQDPETRSIIPVACLAVGSDRGSTAYEFRYLKLAERAPGFRPFFGFPDFGKAYRSNELFPFFENRLMSSRRDDYGEYLASLDLARDADPFEVLGRSGGRRATDRIEVFPEPLVDPTTETASCRFLVRGVRHIPGAQDAIDRIGIGERLSVLPDPQNPIDRLALLLRNTEYRLVGFVPAFLTSVIHRSVVVMGWENVEVKVEHIADRDGPVHLRLLCHLEVPWPFERAPFSGPDFEFFEAA